MHLSAGGADGTAKCGSELRETWLTLTCMLFRVVALKQPH